MTAKSPRDILIRPVVSEKWYAAFDANVYTFLVAHDANKIEIKNAVESIFGVRVTNVNTLNRKGKRKKNRRTGNWAHAPPASAPSCPLPRRSHRDLRELTTMPVRKRKPTSPGRRFQTVSERRSPAIVRRSRSPSRSRARVVGTPTAA